MGFIANVFNTFEFEEVSNKVCLTDSELTEQQEKLLHMRDVFFYKETKGTITCSATV